MNNTVLSRSLLAALVAGTLSFPAMADQAMTAAQLKEAFSNKTITAVNHNKGNKSQLTYFAADGKVTQKTTEGKLKQGTWRVSEPNQQCIAWEGQKEVCSTVTAKGDGTYQRTIGAKAAVTIQNMRTGNLLNE